MSIANDLSAVFDDVGHSLVNNFKAELEDEIFSPAEDIQDVAIEFACDKFFKLAERIVRIFAYVIITEGLNRYQNFLELEYNRACEVAKIECDVTEVKDEHLSPMARLAGFGAHHALPTLKKIIYLAHKILYKLPWDKIIVAIAAGNLPAAALLIVTPIVVTFAYTKLKKLAKDWFKDQNRAPEEVDRQSPQSPISAASTPVHVRSPVGPDAQDETPCILVSPRAKKKRPVTLPARSHPIQGGTNPAGPFVPRAAAFEMIPQPDAALAAHDPQIADLIDRDIRPFSPSGDAELPQLHELPHTHSFENLNRALGNVPSRSLEWETPPPSRCREEVERPAEQLPRFSAQLYATA
ncbi:MAG: hypothetical protein S4CHLAM102_05840 [Chlamydiia bacterium]|nr:hypothetical protein [Chlamydiia bacterium]